MHGTVNLT